MHHVVSILLATGPLWPLVLHVLARSSVHLLHDARQLRDKLSHSRIRYLALGRFVLATRAQLSYVACRCVAHCTAQTKVAAGKLLEATTSASRFYVCDPTSLCGRGPWRELPQPEELLLDVCCQVWLGCTCDTGPQNELAPDSLILETFNRRLMADVYAVLCVTLLPIVGPSGAT